MDKHIKRYAAETKALEETRSLIVTISTDAPDRDGDVVVPKGGKLDNFLKNPVVLFGHKYNEPPIAKASELTIDEHGIKAKVTFPDEGVYAFADAIYGLIKAGIMHAWSIGFQADSEAVEKIEGGGLKFKRWELLEFSAVPVPANPEALTILRSKGLSDELIKEMTVEASKVEKDVAEVISLAYVIDELNWLIYAFGKNEVSEDSINRMKEALVILLEVLKQQAKLGKKEFPIDRSQQAPALPELPEKPDADALVKTLTAIRDNLKPADKEIGLALRTLKTLIAKPAN